MNTKNLTTAWKLADCAEGKGIFAKRDITEGETVFYTYLERPANARGKTSFEVDRGAHYELSFPAPMVNHGCVPNLSIKSNNSGCFNFVALRNIPQGTQLRTHYAMHEWRSVSVDECKCASSGCRGRAFGFAELDPDNQETILALGCADHLRRLHSNTTDPPRGLHATIAMSGIAPTSVPVNTPVGKRRLQAMIEQLTRYIGMNPYGDCVLEYYPEDGSSLEGWTAVQLIETSSIALHFYRSGAAWFDITSCKPFNVDATGRWIAERLSAKTWEASTMELV